MTNTQARLEGSEEWIDYGDVASKALRVFAGQ